MSQRDTVDARSTAYETMARRWALLESLTGGTKAMRDAGETWLPREPKEESTHYKNRVARSFLFNGFAETVDRVPSKPFSRPVTIEGNVPEPLDQIEDNADLQGRTLTQFARDVMESMVSWGLTHILIDHPSTDGVQTLEDERRRGIRPFFTLINPTNLIGWRTSQDLDGNEILSQIRFREERVEPKGAYTDERVEYIRVYGAGGESGGNWELWRKGEDDEEFSLHKSGTHTFPENRVPLVTVYAARTGFMTARPPFEELGWTNLAHWQSYSDQRNLLRFARVGVPVFTGFPEDDLADWAPGANSFVRTENENAKFGYLEPSGAAIEAGRQDILDLQERMEAQAMEPFLKRTGNETATGQAIDEAKSQTDVKAWIAVEELGLTECYRDAATWVRAELDDEFTVQIFKDFGLSVRAQQDIVALLEMRKNREISRETYLKEVRRRGLFSELVEIEEEIDRIEEEKDEMPAPFTPVETEDPEDPEGVPGAFPARGA